MPQRAVQHHWWKRLLGIQARVPDRARDEIYPEATIPAARADEAESKTPGIQTLGADLNDIQGTGTDAEQEAKAELSWYERANTVTRPDPKPSAGAGPEPDREAAIDEAEAEEEAAIEAYAAGQAAEWEDAENGIYATQEMAADAAACEAEKQAEADWLGGYVGPQADPTSEPEAEAEFGADPW